MVSKESVNLVSFKKAPFVTGAIITNFLISWFSHPPEELSCSPLTRSNHKQNSVGDLTSCLCPERVKIASCWLSVCGCKHWLCLLQTVFRLPYSLDVFWQHILDIICHFLVLTAGESSMPKVDRIHVFLVSSPMPLTIIQCL